MRGFFFSVVPNCIVFSSIKSIENINKLLVQMLRKTTSISAAAVNKFVNKAEVISAKSENAKKHALEMIDIRNNQTNS